MQSYAEALGWLYARQGGGIRLGLERVARLLADLGDPQNTFGALHVAGTNGKGITAAWLHAALKAEGYRTGLYMSPHVSRFGERIQVDDEPISQKQVLDGLNRLRPLVEARDAVGDTPTFFEIVTALAFDHFRAAGVEVAVVEVGLGGRLDATNLVQPLVSVITSIGLDHLDRLGPTLAHVAAEKAGIIRNQVPVVTAADGEALDVIAGAARTHGARLVHVRPNDLRILKSDLERTVFEADAWGARRVVHLSALGAHQAQNALVALRTLEALPRFRVLPETAIDAMADVALPGRMERLGTDPAVWLDGAHNPEAMRRLAELVGSHAGQPVRLLFGCLADKDLNGLIEALLPLRPEIIVTRVPNARAAEPSSVAAAFESQGVTAKVVDDLDAALKLWRMPPNAFRLATGSLFLVGALRDRLLRQASEPVATPIHQ
jgi:dihydrofolate synthase / folylpolyglutamate synthase